MGHCENLIDLSELKLYHENYMCYIFKYKSVSDLYGDVLRRTQREGKLFSDGKFRLTRPGITETNCMVDVTYFPFDEQVTKLTK